MFIPLTIILFSFSILFLCIEGRQLLQKPLAPENILAIVLLMLAWTCGLDLTYQQILPNPLEIWENFLQGK